MFVQRSHQLRATLMAADALAMGVAFVVAYYLGGPLMTAWFDMLVVLPIHRYLWILAVSIPAAWIILGSFGAYDLTRFEEWTANPRRLLQALFVHGLLISALVFFAKETLFARRVIGLFILCNAVGVSSFRPLALSLARRMARSRTRERRVLIVGGGAGARRFVEWVARSGWGLRVVGALSAREAGVGAPWLGTPDRLREILDREVIDDVIIAEPAEGRVDAQEVIRQCEEIGCIVHIQSDFFQATLSRPHVESFGELSFLTFSATPFAPLALAAKRAIDLVGAAAMLVLTSPCFVVLPVFIRRASDGPAIFRQERIGLNGRRFQMYKFRSMVTNAEALREQLEPFNEMGGPAFKMEADPRVTWIGRILRRYSLDELPQLWNVLKGDMSLVGPRPPLPRELVMYERWQRRRLSMRPGMTGLYQIRGRHRLGFDEWMRCDLEYIDTWSLWRDFKIMLATIPAIVKGTGA